MFFLVTIFATLSANALIKAPLDIFGASSAVLRMKVAAVNPQSNGIELTLSEVALGKYEGNTVKLQLGRPEGLFEKIKKEDPVIVFINRRGVNDVIHIADTWIIVSQNEAKTAWIGQTERKEFYLPFPGTTATLDQMVINRKANKNPILDELEEKQIFAGKPIKLGPAPSGATSVHALGHFLFFNTPGEIRVLKLAKGKLENTDVKIDGETRGVVFGTLITTNGAWRVNQDVLEKTQSPWPPADKKVEAVDPLKNPSATALNLTPDKPAILAIDKTGPLLRQVKTSETTIDFTRLTGRNWSDIAPENLSPDQTTLKTLDINNDNLDDVLILWKEGGVLLVNRGYDCFFASETSVKNLLESAKEAGVNVEGIQIAPMDDGMIVMGKDRMLVFIENLEKDK